MRSLFWLIPAVVLAGCEQGAGVVVPAVYDSAEVETRSIQVTVDAAGVVEPESTVEVKSKASGEVLRDGHVLVHLAADPMDPEERPRVAALGHPDEHRVRLTGAGGDAGGDAGSRVDLGRELREARLLKQRSERELHPELAMHPRHEPHGQQRVPTGREEVVVPTGRRRLQQLAPEPGEAP